MATTRCSKPTFSAAAIRSIDRLAVERFGIPSIVLMENAARGVADAVARLRLPQRPRTIVVCGPGNNGGDGYAVARLLHNAGHRVRVVVVAPPGDPRGDAAVTADIVERMGLPRHVSTPRRPLPTGPRADLIVDAIFGTGLTRPLAGVPAAAVAAINRRRTRGAIVVAVDVPSGLDADAGAPVGDRRAVVADVTVTFVGLKRGFCGAVARRHLGRVVVAGIGVPRELVGTHRDPDARADRAPRVVSTRPRARA